MTQREIKRQLSKAKEQEEKISLGLSSAIKATGLWIDTPPILGYANWNYRCSNLRYYVQIEGVYPWKV